MSNRYSSPIRSPIDSPASSVRPSLDIPAANNIRPRRTSPSPNPTTQRRNRAALRDYYNIQASNPTGRTTLSRTASIASTTSTITTNATPIATTAPPFQGEVLPLIDSPDFSADSYVSSLLSTSSLTSILRAESTLVSEIKNLDGERKALVYDNYSKLIRATETIGQLQKGMDQQGGVKVMESMSPAIANVANTAGEIQKARRESAGKKNREVNTVQWVLDAPQRFTAMIEDGYEDQVREQWQEVSDLLESWKHVKGAGAIKSACEGVLHKMETKSESSDD